MKPAATRPIWPLIAVAMIAALIFGFIAIRTMTRDRVEPPPIAAAPPPASIPEGPQPPAALQQQISALGRSFDGRVGIAVRSIADGWTASHGGGVLYPQQSVSKLWVAATVMDRADKGTLRLTDTIPLTKRDLTIFHQPIRTRIGDGVYPAKVSELLWLAMTQSDNTANDALFRRVGGQQGVGAFLAEKGLDEIAMSAGEKALQMEIAGMEWDDAYSYGRTFWTVRESLPIPQRAKALGNYVTNPSDGATPEAIAKGLSRLKRGELVSAASTAYLLNLMNQSKTGPDRLKSGLSDGWTLAHKTGTGQVMGYYATAYNDVGILSSPMGKHYAVVVMVASTRRSVPQRQALMGAVTRTVIACRGC
jgi:beta-lactamase class A